MTTASAYHERGGATHPSRPRTVLVVSGDATTQADWSAYLHGLGMRTHQCAGPEARCALLEGAFRCPLHAEADVALYDRECVTASLVLRLIRASRTLPIAFASDRVDPDGRHRPAVTAVASEGHGAETCVGLPLDKLGR